MAQGDKLYPITDPMSPTARINRLEKQVKRLQSVLLGRSGGGGSGPLDTQQGTPPPPKEDLTARGSARVSPPDPEEIEVQIQGEFTKDGIFQPTIVVNVDGLTSLVRGFNGYDFRVTSSSNESQIVSGGVEFDGATFAPLFPTIKVVKPPVSYASSEAWTVEVRTKSSIFGVSKWSAPVEFILEPDPDPPPIPDPVTWGPKEGGLGIVLTPPSPVDAPDYSHTEIYYGVGDFAIGDGVLVGTTNQDAVTVPFDYKQDFLDNGYDTVKIRHVDNTGNVTDLSTGATISTADAEATRVLGPHLTPFSVQPEKLEFGIKGFWPNGNVEVPNEAGTFPQAYDGLEECVWAVGSGTSGPHVMKLGGDTTGLGALFSPFVHWTNFNTTGAPWYSFNSPPTLRVTWDQAWTLPSNTYTAASLTIYAYDANKELLQDNIPVQGGHGIDLDWIPNAGPSNTWSKSFCTFSGSLPTGTVYIRFVWYLYTDLDSDDSINVYLDNFESQTLDFTHNYGMEFYNLSSGVPNSIGTIRARSDGKVEFSLDAEFIGDFEFNSDLLVDGNLRVVGTSLLDGDVTASGRLDVTGGGSFGSSLLLADVHITSTSLLDGDATFNGLVTFNNDVQFNARLDGLNATFVGSLSADSITNASQVITGVSTSTVPLTINAPSGQTASLLEAKVNSVSKFTVDKDGAITVTMTSTGTVPLTINAPTGQTANLLEAKVNAVSKFSVTKDGNLTAAGTITGTTITGTSASFGTGTVASGTIDITPSGTGTIGIQLHAASGQSVNLLELFVNAVSKFLVDKSGNVTSAGTFFKLNGNKMTIGSSFPGSPTSGDTHYHTALFRTAHYDGSRWLSEPFQFAIGQTYPGGSGGPWSANQEALYTDMPGDYALRLLYFKMSRQVNGTHDNSNKWTVHLRMLDSGGASTTDCATLSSWSNTGGGWQRITGTTTFSAQPSTSNGWLQIFIEKVGSPGTLDATFYVRACEVLT